MTDSSKEELEKIRKLRAEFENKLANATRDRKALEEEMQILREKAAVRELEDKLREEQDAIAGLRIEKKGLENKSKSTKEFATSGIIQKPGAETKDKIDKPETDEQTRIIWKKDEQTPENTKPLEDENKELEEQEKKKKLKFF